MIEIVKTNLFNKWLSSLRDRKARECIYARLDRMEDGNLGDVRPVGNGISEARIHYGPGYRLYFMQRGNVLIVMLAGGNKGSQHRDIALAKRIAEYWSET